MNYYFITPSKQISVIKPGQAHSCSMGQAYAMMSSQWSRNRWAELLLHPGRYAESGSGKYVSGRVEVREQVWLNDSRDSVYVHCRIIANWHVLSYKAEALENNWALAPMDQWKRYGNASNCQY